MCRNTFGEILANTSRVACGHPLGIGYCLRQLKKESLSFVRRFPLLPHSGVAAGFAGSPPFGGGGVLGFAALASCMITRLEAAIFYCLVICV
jgi:hypothetical protein